jgi:Transposase DDE domain
METMPLNFGRLMGYLHHAISGIPDPRQASNATRYSLRDVVLAAFSVFFMQCESFLENQRQMQSRSGQDNAQTLFGLERLPAVPQIRNVLDGIAAQWLFGVFGSVYQALIRGGYLKAYEVLDGHLLVTLDGTEYFRSAQVQCSQCSHRTHGNGQVSYSHSAILPVIVAPGQSEVISLAPEFITPQDGHEKQDCEVAAAKRWMSSQAPILTESPVILLGDDLYSHQPMIEACTEANLDFIFTCLPDSHPTLYEGLAILERLGQVHHRSIEHKHLRSHQVYRYRYAHQLPLRDTEPTLFVNWCELTLVRVSDQKVLYHNAWITLLPLTEANVPEVAASARCRWKTENENHNVLKTKGYHLEHNFGHGQQQLSATLLTLNLLAFLFHTVLQLVDQTYQRIRKQRGTRKGFFQDILSLTKYFLFDSWHDLIDFMLTGKPEPRAPNSS